jgi:NAD-dependent dihydropyrimidine dehydrogenase PreA subunit
MEGEKMARIEEIPWIEEAATGVTEAQSLKGNAVAPRINLYRIPWIRAVLESRWPQFMLRALTLMGFVFTITTALLGPRVGSHNFAIIMVWIAWWTTLKLGFIPLGGRSWCSICPIPLPGDWLKQGGILEKGGRGFGINLRWPKSLRGSWLQSGGFLLIGMFSAITLTDPHVTGWVLLAIFALAIGMGLVFEQRAFCSYICPIGGFSGMYAKAAPVEVRVIDEEICARHGDKSCYRACPWGIYPVTMKDSTACGLCMECLRACPKDNLALNLRPYGTDLKGPVSSSRLDETFLALIMLGSALAFSAVFLGPWGWLKSSAYELGSQGWLVYAMGFLVLNLVFLPAVFTVCVWLWEKIRTSRQPLKRLIANEAQGLIPLGLMAWIAFTISFALPKLNYVVGVLNDPFGWGWHLLNTVSTSRSLDVSGFSPILQILLLLVGMLWSANVTRKLAKSNGTEKPLPNIPVLGFYLVYSIAMLWLLVG